MGNSEQVFTYRKKKPNRREADLEKKVDWLRDVITEVTA